MERRIRIGELLVEAQVITREQLERVLAQQEDDGRRLGTILVESGLVSETRVTQILSQQLSVPWVSLYHVDFSRQLLNLVPRELAEQFCLVPIFVRKIRGVGETLYVAMDDPSDARARELVSHYAGLPVRAMIAPPSDIRSAIRVYYGARSLPPQPRSSQPSNPKLPAAPPTTDPPGPKPLDEGPSVEVSPATADVAAEAMEVLADHYQAEATQAPPSQPQQRLPDPSASWEHATALSAPYGSLDEAAPDSGIPIPSRGASMPKPKQGTRARMITLTLLDGTQVALPARPRTPPAAAQAPAENNEPHPLTASDLVTALHAASHGADASAILGAQPRWEPIVAALLSVLLKKHLIADWEFVEELKEL